MANSFPQEGKSFPRDLAVAGAATLDRLASFRVTYVAIFAFLLLYVLTLDLTEFVLHDHFTREVTRATQVEAGAESISERIQQQVDKVILGSAWTRLGGVRVTAIVLGADGRTPLYLGGPIPLPPAELDPFGQVDRADELLPAAVDVIVAVPLGTLLASSILIVYGALLMQFLFLYTRRIGRLEARHLAEASASRDAVALRAERIESELRAVRQRLDRVEPLEESHAGEIRSLETERSALQDKLEVLEQRESELRGQASQAQALQEESRTLEELLDEAVQDLETRDNEIQSLQGRLKQASARSTPRLRESDQLAKRLRTLYKNLEFDDQAISSLVGLRDENMKLKAEENLKRLSDEAENAAIRRKVGGLPPQLSIFELGFGGRGRIYYTKGRQRRFRVLLVGAKNSQKTDLEYLSRLRREAST